MLMYKIGEIEESGITLEHCIVAKEIVEKQT